MPNARDGVKPSPPPLPRPWWQDVTYWQYDAEDVLASRPFRPAEIEALYNIREECRAADREPED